MTNNNEPTLSLSTLVEVSGLIGFPFGRNSSIRNAQDQELVLNLQKTSSVTIDNKHKKDYYFGTLDFLVYEDNGNKQFKFLEFSGTGSGGISNISFFAINAVLAEFEKVHNYINHSCPIILLAYTDSQSLSNSIPRKFVYERFFFSQSIKQGFREKQDAGTILTLPEIIQNNSFSPTQPTIVIGFLKDFMKYLSCKDRKIYFLDQPISALFNDTLCNNTVERFKDEIDLNSIYNINSIFRLSTDKSLAYSLFNSFLKKKEFKYLSKPINFTLASSRENLISELIEQTNTAKKVVIKPYSGSVGMGVEFFLQPESEEIITAKVDNSIKMAKRFQGAESRVFPYTISEFIDYFTIPQKKHPLFAHKYELRVIVYREDNKLKAFPSVVRVAGLPYDESNFDRLMLLSYASLGDSKITMPKYKFLMPLSNNETLNILGLKMDELEDLCSFSTNYINYTIRELSQNLF